jgi:hypothetical protein
MSASKDDNVVAFLIIIWLVWLYIRKGKSQ